MSDCEKLTTDNEESVQDYDSAPRVGDRDDLSGMTVGMFGKLDIRELLILWIGFLFLHTEMFSTMFLKRFKGATHDDGSPTMKGTIYASIFMMALIAICTIIF